MIKNITFIAVAFVAGLAGSFAPAAMARLGISVQSTVQIEPAVPGEYVTARPVIRAVSPDDNAYIDYITKGEGAHVFRGWNGAAHAFVAYAQSPLGQNFLEAHGTIGPPELRATGPVGSVDLMLRPQREGVVLARNGVEMIAISETGEKTTLGSFAHGILSLVPVEAPRSAAGSALLFLDKADGVVKVRYGDGRTIAFVP